MKTFFICIYIFLAIASVLEIVCNTLVRHNKDIRKLIIDDIEKNGIENYVRKTCLTTSLDNFMLMVFWLSFAVILICAN